MAAPLLGTGFGTTQAGSAFSSPTPSTPVGIPTASVQFQAPRAQAMTVNPGPGSADAAAAQQANDLQKYFPNMNTAPSGISNNLASVKYSITPNPTIGSGSFAPTTTADALAARSNAANGMMNGTTNGIPSTEFLKSIYGNYATAASDYTNSAAAINSERLAQINQVQSSYTQGGITTAGRDAAINDINQRYGSTLSTLETTNQAANANMDAYSRFYSTFMKPQEVSPGSQLVTPQGQPVYQGNGAAPSTIMQTAMQLWQQAQTAGTATYNSDGTPDLQPYLEQSQNYYQTHQILGGGTQNPAGGAGGGTSQVPITQTSDGGTVSPEYGQMISTLPPAIQPYVKSGPNGVAYIDTSLLPTGLQGLALTANAKGIPALSHDDVLGLQAIGNLYSTLDQVQGLVDATLSSGVTGKAWNSLQSFVNNYTGFKPILDNYANLRETAGKTTTALMGGIGSGFRMNNATLDTAVNNLPTPTSSLEQANVKINAVRALLDNGVKQKFPTFQGTGSLQSNGSTGEGGSIWSF